MKPMETKLAYVPKRMEAKTVREKAKLFNKWGQRLLVSETCDK